jgi:hypothetical protein
MYGVSSFEARIAVDRLAALSALANSPVSPAAPQPPTVPFAPAPAAPPAPAAVSPVAPAPAPVPRAPGTTTDLRTETAPTDNSAKSPVRNIVIFVIVLATIYLVEHFIFGKPRHWTWQDALLKIGLPAAFLLGLLWIITRLQAGIRYRGLPPDVRRRMTLQISGLSLMVVAVSFTLFMFFPIRITDFKEYWFVPNSAAYQKLTFTGEFTSYHQPMGNHYDVAPDSWKLGLMIYTNDD